MSAEESVTKIALAQKLGVARSTLYYQKKLPEKDEELRRRIEETWVLHPAYGHRRLATHLKVGKDRILRVMRLFQMKPPLRGVARPAKPEDVGKDPAPYPNLIKTLCPLAPGVVWVADFTYLPFHGSFLFLATVLDLFSREAVGWQVLSVHTAVLIKAAFADARQRTGKTPRYHHSDQGSEYQELAHLQVVESLGITVSMSKKASPWENGYQESFYGKFKLELGSLNRFNTVGEAIAAIYAQIRYYNQERIHSALNMPPLIFAQQFYEKTALQSREKCV